MAADYVSRTIAPTSVKLVSIVPQKHCVNEADLTTSTGMKMKHTTVPMLKSSNSKSSTKQSTCKIEASVHNTPMTSILKVAHEYFPPKIDNVTLCDSPSETKHFHLTTVNVSIGQTSGVPNTSDQLSVIDTEQYPMISILKRAAEMSTSTQDKLSSKDHHKSDNSVIMENYYAKNSVVNVTSHSNSTSKKCGILMQRKSQTPKFRSPSAEQQHLSVTSERISTHQKKRRKPIMSSGLLTPPKKKVVLTSDGKRLVATAEFGRFVEEMAEQHVEKGAVLFAKYDNQIGIAYANDVLTRTSKMNVSTTPPFQPCGGEIYLVDTRVHKRDWTVDGYSWLNRGSHASKRLNIIKSYFLINRQKDLCSSRFTRSAYTLIDNSDYVLVHYIGDKSAFVPKAHGNATKNCAPFERVMPSSITNAKKKLCMDTASHVLADINSAISDEGGDVRFCMRNVKQLNNLRANILPTKRINIDDIIEVHKMAQTPGQFIRNINMHPNFLCIAAYKQIVKFINGSLSRHFRIPLIFCFQTMNVGNYNVSVLLCKCFLIEQIIPVACVLHEQKLDDILGLTIYYLVQFIPHLTDNLSVFVINQMNKQEDEIRKHCSQIHVAYCWNFLVNMFKRTYRKNETYKKYHHDIRTLLDVKSQQIFHDCYEQRKENWTKQRVMLFENSMKYAILQNSGRWQLEALNIYTEGSGIEMLCLEVWDEILQQLVEKEEIKPTTILDAFFELQCSIWQSVGIVDTAHCAQSVGIVDTAHCAQSVGIIDNAQCAQSDGRLDSLR